MRERYSRTRLSTALFVLLALIALPPSVSAQDRDWKFEIGIYGWLPTINGELAYDVPGVGDEIKVDPGMLIDNLQFTAMGALAAGYKKWSIFADVIYLKEAKNTSAQLPIGEGVNLEAAFELKSWIADPGVAYELVRSGGTTLAVLIGVRYFYANTSLSLKASGPVTADTTLVQSTHVWNGVVGASGRIELGKRWFIPYHLDLGTGDSDFTWQGMAGISYNFNWGGLFLAYRYIDFNQGDKGGVRSLSFGGPEFGVGFRF